MLLDEVRFKLRVIVLTLVLSSAFGASLAICEEKLHIGVSAPLSGDGASFGMDIRDVVSFANDELAQGRYELIFEDDKCNPKDGVTVANKLISQDRIRYVVGFGCSGAALSAAPLFERSRTLAIVSVASSPKIADAGEYIFRTAVSDRDAAKLLAGFVKFEQRKRVGVLSAESEYSLDFKNVFVESAAEFHFEVITEDYLATQSDFRTQILKLRKAGIDALFVNSWLESDFIQIIRQLGELQWAVPVYAAYYPSSPVVIQAAGAYLEGVKFVDAPSLESSLNGEGKALYERYKSKYGPMRSTEGFFATTFEAMRVLHLAIQSGEDPRKFLLSHAFDGILGRYSFDTNGEIVGPKFQIKEIQNGKPVDLPVNR